MEPWVARRNTWHFKAYLQYILDHPREHMHENSRCSYLKLAIKGLIEQNLVARGIYRASIFWAMSIIMLTIVAGVLLLTTMGQQILESLFISSRRVRVMVLGLIIIECCIALIIVLGHAAASMLVKHFPTAWNKILGLDAKVASFKMPALFVLTMGMMVAVGQKYGSIRVPLFVIALMLVACIGLMALLIAAFCAHSWWKDRLEGLSGALSQEHDKPSVRDNVKDLVDLVVITAWSLTHKVCPPVIFEEKPAFHAKQEPE
jgi:hypothetical protein